MNVYMPISRVFNNGNSQAVRIPAEFRLDTDRVDISRTSTGDLLIRPMQSGRGQAFVQALAALRDLDPQFIAALESDRIEQLPMQDREVL